MSLKEVIQIRQFSIHERCRLCSRIGATSLVGPSVLDLVAIILIMLLALVLLDACKTVGISRFVFASSAAVYGEP